MKRRKKPSPVATNDQTHRDQAMTRAELEKTRTEQARTRAELVKTRHEQERTRAELAKTRTEQRKTRTELMKTRRKKIKIRTQQVEKTLERIVHKEFDIHDKHQKIPATCLKGAPLKESAIQKNALERLTNRQREILRLLTASQNTKQIAGTLHISPKTVEYHRGKLMTALNVHDVAGLVRFALRAGLIPMES